MQVTAFSTPMQPKWRWRVVNYAGEVVEESRELFPTIAAAVACGAEWLSEAQLVDRSSPMHYRRSTSHLRAR